MNRDPTPGFPVPNDKKEKSKDTEGFASNIFLTKPYLRIKYITFNIICKDQICSCLSKLVDILGLVSLYFLPPA